MTQLHSKQMKTPNVICSQTKNVILLFKTVKHETASFHVQGSDDGAIDQ